VEALAIVSGVPPPASMRFNLPSAKKPSDLLSGDQNGKAAFSVPFNARGVDESRRRTQISDGPSLGFAMNATLLPSGERIAADDSKSNEACSGAVISVITNGSGARGRRAKYAPTAPATINAATSAAYPRP